MKRVQIKPRSRNGSSQEEDQDEENDPHFGHQHQQRPNNFQHYVGHSLIRQQQGLPPPPTFRPLSRTQAAYPQKVHKQGLKPQTSNGGAKTNEMTCLQRRAAELTGMPLINFNIKRPPLARVDNTAETTDTTIKPEVGMKFEDFTPHQHPPLYQPHHIHNLVVQQHLRFLSAYQHSGLLAMKNQGLKDSPTTTGSTTYHEQNQDRILRKNYSMCENLLLGYTDQESGMKNLWGKESGEYNYDFEEQLNNPLNRTTGFKLGATLSLPQILLVGDDCCPKEIDNFAIRNIDVQMGKEDEARFLPTDLLSDELTPADPVDDSDTDYGYNDVKSLPSFPTEPSSKKQPLRKTLSLQGESGSFQGDLLSSGPSDFSLFPQTSQSDLLCSLRSSLVKSSTENFETNQVRIEDEAAASPPDKQLFSSNRKAISTRHLERAIKSLSINADISRKF